jgi:hypothetical protein
MQISNNQALIGKKSKAGDVGLEYPIFPRVIYLGTAIYAARSFSEQSQTLHYLSEKTRAQT